METPNFLNLLSYNKETGKLYWVRVSKYHNEKLGREAGTLAPSGYRKVKVKGRAYPAHRIVWMFETGEYPENSLDIDHINNNKSDNRFENLRLVSRRENVKNTPARSNNNLGEKYIRKLGKKYQVRYDGKSYGCYSTLEEAKKVRFEVAVKLNLEYWMVQQKGQKFDVN